MAQQQRPPLVVPMVLIVVGALFLYANYRPSFDAWYIVKTYWPLILVFAGLGKMVDSMRQRENPNHRSSVPPTVGLLGLILVVVVLLLHGRGFAGGRRFAFEPQHLVRSVERQGAHSVRASIRTGAGEVTIAGGSSNVLDADFSFEAGYASPRIEYNVASEIGELAIAQESDSPSFVGSRNQWNLRFSDEIPLELKIDMGAGHGRFNFQNIPLTRLDLQMGAGQIDVDLTGDRRQDLNGEIKGGVGQATIRLPKNMGVSVTARGGIGAVSSHGFTKNGDGYTNEAYGKTPATIRLNFEGGIGEVDLIQQP
jgi:hypothetical protein